MFKPDKQDHGLYTKEEGLSSDLCPHLKNLCRDSSPEPLLQPWKSCTTNGQNICSFGNRHGKVYDFVLWWSIIHYLSLSLSLSFTFSLSLSLSLSLPNSLPLFLSLSLKHTQNFKSNFLYKTCHDFEHPEFMSSWEKLELHQAVLEKQKSHKWTAYKQTKRIWKVKKNNIKHSLMVSKLTERISGKLQKVEMCEKMVRKEIFISFCGRSFDV